MSTIRMLAATAAVCLGLSVLSSTAFAQEKGAKPEAKPAAKPQDKPEAKPAAKTQDKAADKKADEKKGDKTGPLCPVMNETIDPKVFVRYQGKRVYLCCKDCIEEFNKSPEKFAKAIQAQWDAMPVYRAQIKCPVTGETPNLAIFVEEPHYDLCFANEDAKAKFVKDRKAYADKLAGCFTYQCTCPTSGKPIKPAISKEIGGKKIYFCCEGCVGKANEETAKKAAEQAAANEEAYKKMVAASAPKKP